MDSLVLQPAQIRLRHVKLGASTDPGAVQVLGQWFTPQDTSDINSRRNRFTTGSSYTRREGQEGEATLVLPNTPGNRSRFLILTNRLSYEAGDEWIEIYETTGADPVGDPLIVITPTDAQITRSTITITGYDALWLAKGERETDAGFWCNAPRDVFEYYCRAWTAVLADDFPQTGRFAYVDSNTNAATGDGRWTYHRCGDDANFPSTVMLQCHAAAAGAYLGTTASPGTDGPAAAWRYEWSFAQITLPTTIPGGTSASLAIEVISATQTYGLTIAWGPAPTLTCSVKDNTGTLGSVQSPWDSGNTPGSVAIERRDRWVYFYIDGTLQALLPAFATSTTLTAAQLTTTYPTAGGVGNFSVYVDSFLGRRSQSLLQRAGIGGDLKLPSTTLPAGGLQGQYFDDHDLLMSDPPNWWKRSLEPTRDKASAQAMTVRRLDSKISFATPAAFNVPVANNEYFSARFTGAIYLDLSTFDYAFRTTSDDRARLWIGKTRLSEQLIDDWTGAGHAATTVTSTWVKAGSAAGVAPSGSTGPLAGQPSGWYPIILEYSQSAGPTGQLTFEMERSDAVGTWATPASSILSPYGIVNTQVRGDSHYEQLQALKSSWGIQFTCAPKTLESGEFPGRVIPVAREGRDTDLIIDGFEGINPQTSINAEDTISALRCDAQGIADPKGTSQLTREAIDYTQIAKHMVVRSDYESLSDITYAPLLEQRARSLLALRGSPFEEVQVQPSGRRGLTDSFPLTGALARMNWLPGDGARLKITELLIDDQTPRQMVEVQWPVRPAGRGRPAVKWRQRTRNFETLFRKHARVALSNDRNYQTQLAIVTSAPGATGAGGAAPDAYARVGLPTNLRDIKRVTLVVRAIVGTWTIEVNGATTGLQVSAAGRYDVSQYIAKSQQQMYARLITGGTSYEITLELLVAT